MKVESPAPKNFRTLAINATNIGRELDGIGRYSLSLIKRIGLSQRNLQIVIYLNKNSREQVARVIFPENCRVRWTTRYISPDYKFIGHLLRLIFSNLISLRHRDVFFFNTSQLEAMFFRREQGLMVHDTIPLRSRSQHQKQYFYFRYLLKYALKSARILVTPSGHSKEQLTTFFRLPANRIRVIHHGIEPDSFRESESLPRRGEKDFILFVGRSSPVKNISGLLRAFETLKSRIPHKLVLAGTAAGRVEARYLIEGGRVEAKGYLPLGELIRLYQRASLLVLPSFSEGFGFPPLEAMACGCPVVVSNTSSLPEVCGEAAYYVDPYSIESIAEGIHRVLTDESLRKTLIARGLERARTFTWEKSAQGHLNALVEVL